MQNYILNYLILIYTFQLLGACTSAPKKLISTSVNESEVLKIQHPMFIADAIIPDIVEVLPQQEPLPAPALFTISIISVPVLEFVQALATDAGLQLSVVGSPAGTLTMEKHDSSVSEIMSEVALQAKIRYEISGEKLVLYEDIPYLKLYKINYLNMTRSLSSEIDLATQIDSISLDVSGTKSGLASSNNSRASIHNTSEHRFWDTLKNNLERIVAVEKNKNVDVIVNKEAGIVVVKADHKTQIHVSSFIKRVEKSAGKQVFIEALVVEVSLNQDFQAGIDWRILSAKTNGSNYIQNLTGSSAAVRETSDNIVAPAAILSVFRKSLSGTDILATLTLLEQFGDTEILSSPKINALNNQSAVLKVVDNRVYFSIGVQKIQTENSLEKLTTTSEIKTVPIGLVMNVIPYISDTNQIILNVRPTISRILGFVADPNPDLANAGVKNNVPEIQVREMESILRVESGGMVVMGGLMQERVQNKLVSVPYLSRIPILGKLFSYKKEQKVKTELLVFLRPVVLDENFYYNDLALEHIASGNKNNE